METPIASPIPERPRDIFRQALAAVSRNRRRSSNLPRAVAFRGEKAGDPVAAVCEGPVEETRHDPGAGEPEEDGGPAVSLRAAQDLGERFFPGEDHAVRQDEVHRLEAGGFGDRGESRTGFPGAAGKELESVGGHGVAQDPVGGRAAHRAIRVEYQDGRARVHQRIVYRESW